MRDTRDRRWHLFEQERIMDFESICDAKQCLLGLFVRNYLQEKTDKIARREGHEDLLVERWNGAENDRYSLLDRMLLWIAASTRWSPHREGHWMGDWQPLPSYVSKPRFRSTSVEWLFLYLCLFSDRFAERAKFTRYWDTTVMDWIVKSRKSSGNVTQSIRRHFETRTHVKSNRHWRNDHHNGNWSAR